MLASLDGGRNILATLAHSELTYLQASGSVQTGFALDHQERSLDRHYKSRGANLPLDEVTDIFQKYARGDESWRHGVEWEPVPHVPPKTPWFSLVELMALLFACAPAAHDNLRWLSAAESPSGTS